jgi:hypothetical protein
VEVTVKQTGGQDLTVLAARLRALGDGGELRKELSRTLTGAIKPAKAQVQSAVRSLPVSARRLWSGDSGFQRTAYTYGRGKKSEGVDERRAVRSFQRSSSLRGAIAAATGTYSRTSARSAGVGVRVDGGRLPADQRTLPRNLDDPKGWRHPLFGDRDHWVQQTGRPYFAVTMDRHRDKYQKAVRDAMDAVARKATGA